MSPVEPTGAAVSTADLYQTDEKYQFRLTDILRKRRRPLLLMIDEEGELLSSSLPEEAPPADHRLLGQALAEAKILFQTESPVNDVVTQLVVNKPGQRSALVVLNGEFFTLRLFPLYGLADEIVPHKYAALVEPIVGPLAEGINFARVKETYRLSNREVNVLEALMSGSKDKEIARALGVTAGTVRAYLKSVRAKLGVTTRTAIVNRVHEHSTDGTATHD